MKLPFLRIRTVNGKKRLLLQIVRNLESMRQNLEMVAANRRELNGEVQPEEMAYQEASGQVGQEQDEDFEFDENTFLDNIEDEE